MIDLYKDINEQIEKESSKINKHRRNPSKNPNSKLRKMTKKTRVRGANKEHRKE